MKVDLISRAVGGRVVSCSDDFFAEAENLLNPDPPLWKEHEYTDRGKWMDGWESRRRRDPGHDWCVIALGIPGQVRSVSVDTSHFTGNYPEQFSLDVCGVGSDDLLDRAEWTEVISRTNLQGDSQVGFDLDAPYRVTHVRLNIYPDGGVARLRVLGDPVPEMREICSEQTVDLVSMTVGGKPMDTSDSFFSPAENMLRPTKPGGMWDGWETKRRRGPGHDWAVFRLGLPGLVENVVVDTSFFKGNAPGWVSVHLSEDAKDWETAVDRAEVEPDAENTISLEHPSHASYLKLDIHPDGGVARFRAWGRADSEAAGQAGVRYLNSLLPAEARSFFGVACSATNWVEKMVISRPFQSPDEVLAHADRVFGEMTDQDWIQAFAGHPRIGERTKDQVAGREQAGTAAADAETLEALAAANSEYEQRHGFTYIVYATGKSASEMLDIAKARLDNDRDTEISLAGVEQRRITATRLRRMLCQEVSP